MNGGMSLLMFATVFMVLLAGYPVAFSLAGTALGFAVAGQWLGTFDFAFLEALPNRLFGIMTNQTLVAVPLFVSCELPDPQALKIPIIKKMTRPMKTSFAIAAMSWRTATVGDLLLVVSLSPIFPTGRLVGASPTCFRSHAGRPER